MGEPEEDRERKIAARDGVTGCVDGDDGREGEDAHDIDLVEMRGARTRCAGHFRRRWGRRG
jgi:hypothetical protein